ncbi:MAG TPA: helix-turn-helix domain-containing protein [Rhodanobacteraceae bacterium]|nr:helix-turn-helix domain-containing protein [Rhodanobacteraceae bacterium]
MYRYKGCGLDNVYLRNGYTSGRTKSGEEVVSIQDVDGLHCALATAIIDSPSSLDAKTFKFLRKELDMSQRQLAHIFDVEEQTVSLWERARTPVPQQVDLLLRALVKETMSGNAELRAMIQRFNSLDRAARAAEARIEMAVADSGHWMQQAA